ncbi:MAG TPA: protein kinase [Bryobacteraceae bacterium]|nr:protein kinase [Bryobacteraceae bacterium]
MIGEVFSHYEILDKLGEGGMGVVYKALDTRLQRLVALKFLPGEITSTPDRIARFEQEARAISALNHPHIATIHSMEEHGAGRFLVLEYLAGGSLRDRIRAHRAAAEPFPLADAVRIGIESAQGLAHAHRRGIVHRDIKPENIMFTADGLLRITDFGLAKSAISGPAREELTKDGVTVGTAPYMAPEQALGNITSPRSDLFALGVTLHETIAGQRPFAGASEFATMHAVINQVPELLHQLRADVPEPLARVVARLLEKDPAGRFQTGDEVAAALSALDTELPTAEITYTPALYPQGISFDRSAFEPTRTMALPVVTEAARRQPKTLWIAAAAFVIAVAGAVSWTFFRHPRHVTQLAVLPFTAKSGNAEDAAFGNGLAGIVSGRLAALGGEVWVIPDNDLHQNRVSTPIEARRIFGVDTVVTGEVERPGFGQDVIRMHLVDTASGRTLRSASAKAGAAATPLEEEVVRQTAAMLGLSLDPLAVSKLRAAATQTANAYDYYVLGSGYLQRYDQAGNIGSAVAAFQRAIQLDPSYAMAYAGLSSAYLLQYRSSRDQQYLERARDAAIQALSRNESLDSPHITLGTIAMLTGQTEEGIRQLRAALDSDPVNADAYRELANAYVQAGRPADAEATYNRAIQLRPNFWIGYLDSATFYNNSGRYPEAEKALRTAASLTPDNYLVYRNLGAVEMARGEWADAERSLKQALASRPSGSVYSNLGTLYIYAGRYADAVPMLEQAVSLGGGDEKHAYLIWGNLGDAYRWTKGREASAAVAYQNAVKLATRQLAVNPKDATLLSQIAVYQAKMGAQQEAKSGIEEALTSAPRDSAVLYRAAIVYELCGERTKSLDNLRAALAAGYSLSVVEREPELAALRQDSGYKAISGKRSSSAKKDRP